MADEKKVEHECVLLEDEDGAPHLTMGDRGFQHYEDGCPAARANRAAAKAGPAMVASNAFREGWERRT